MIFFYWIEFLELKQKYKLKPKMPALLGRGEKQLESNDANNTRFVTNCRWVVEVINSFLKSFKALKHLPNKSLPHTIQDFKIAAALVNKYFKRLFSDEDDYETIVKNMKKNLSRPVNELKKVVEDNKLHLKSKFLLIEASEIQDFPKIDEKMLKTDVTLGSYQLKQAKSYLAEHIQHGKINIRNNKDCVDYEDSKILFSIIQSRHSKAAKYRVYCKYKPNVDCVESIEGWYCTCKSGARTVGCCTHVLISLQLFITLHMHDI